jgi:ABC-type nitrate/sulfonate/bicarbonate transport system permease component
MDTAALDAGRVNRKPPFLPRLRSAAWRRGAAVRPTLIALIFGVIVWELSARLLHFSFLPPFTDVMGAIAEMIASGQILHYLVVSVVALLLGYGLAVIVGVTLGLLMGRYRTLEYLLDPFIHTLLATPKIVLVPILFALFGMSRNIQVAIVFLSAFFVIVVNTTSSIRSIDVSYLEMARSFGANERQVFLKILLPGSLPLTMAGLRLGMGRAVKGMINGEMFITVFGLGGLLRTYGSRFDAEHVFAVLLVVVAVALTFSYIVQSVERRVTRWTEVSK